MFCFDDTTTTNTNHFWKRERIRTKGVKEASLHDTQNTFSFKERCDAGRSRERERERK